jgi:hypothetical protein
VTGATKLTATLVVGRMILPRRRRRRGQSDDASKDGKTAQVLKLVPPDE